MPQEYFLPKKFLFLENIRVDLAPLAPSQVCGSIVRYNKRSIRQIFIVPQIPTQKCLPALLLQIDISQEPKVASI